MKRKIILNLAMSLDGYIAKKDGGFEWIDGDGDDTLNTKEIFDFSDFLDTVDTVVMGRVAYEDCGADDYKDKKVIVATHVKMDDKDGVEFVSDNVVEYVRDLQKEEGKDIWLFGGGGLVDAFIKADVIDEYIVGVIPIILGKGKPLFLGDNPEIKLHLDSYTVDKGLPILKYSRRK